jgi:hypothetical protein
MKRRTVHAIALAFVIVIAASSLYLLYNNEYANAGAPAKLKVPNSIVGTAFPGYNISMLTSKYVQFFGLLKSEGYVSMSDQVFTAKTNATKPIIIDFLLQKGSNSSVSNYTIKSELSLANKSAQNSGSHFTLLRTENKSASGSIVPMYELLDIGVLNLSTVNRSVGEGLPIMPYYQFTSMFAYKNYYGSVTVDAYSNSSLVANASLYLAGYMLNNTVNNTVLKSANHD